MFFGDIAVVAVVLVVIAVLFVQQGLKVVPQQSAWVVERLGRFHTVLNPGLNLIIPFIDRVAYRHSLKEIPLDTPAQVCITRDNTQLTVDGVFGDGTAARIREVIASGEVTAGETDVADWWKDIRYFRRTEFRCPCGRCGGFPVEPQESMVRTVDEIRHRLGVPVSIVDGGGSGVRCASHNAEVGGVANSQHLYGLAADLHSAASPAEMKAVAENVMGHTGGIGVYSWGIHVDTRQGYARWNG